MIAKDYGNYKISIHSGSDKFSVFPSMGELAGGGLHLKTAGTSWLEAMRLVAQEFLLPFTGKCISMPSPSFARPLSSIM